MPRFDTSTLNSTGNVLVGNGRVLGHTESYHLYNGLDCCVTFEVFDKIQELFANSNDPAPRLIYDFERGMQAPALDMMLRGFKVDGYERSNAEKILQAQKAKLVSLLNRYGAATWGKPLNANSPAQLKKFFYEFYRLPEQHAITKGVRTVSTNREALEKLSAYFQVLPIITCILALRDVTKRLSVITSEIGDDGRMRTSYNVAGTETGRWSSSADAFGAGTNLQNITPELRRMFIADKGKKLCYLDLEQAESRVVGLLVWQVTGDPTYLNACESGDLHTTVCKLVWPNRGWTGDAKRDRELADAIFYRQFSYRDMAKRGGHGTNYYGTPRTMARYLKLEERVMHDFQMAYFASFSGIRGWHSWVSRQISLHHELTTPLGRTRTFFGRPGDDATLREAIAFAPQSYVGDLLNCALWRVWKFLPEAELLAQVHDAIVFQYPEECEERVVNTALELCKIPVTVNGIHESVERETRTLIIPSECKVGWNWASDEIHTSSGKKIKNPNGLIKWRGKKDERKFIGGLDRVVSELD